VLPDSAFSVTPPGLISYEDMRSGSFALRTPRFNPPRLWRLFLLIGTPERSAQSIDARIPSPQNSPGGALEYSPE